MNGKPLQGVRVLDLCVVWAGPFATMLLGDLGAEVVKIENPFVFQPMTRGAMARPPQIMADVTNAWQGGYPDGLVGERPWDYTPTFVSVFRNKKSFTVDIRRPEGMDILARLVEKCDVVYENNATGTTEKLGITYDWLKSIKEDIIMMRVPAYGNSGPYSSARALGVHLEGVMGHTMLRGYDDSGPDSNTAIFSGDYLAGAQGAFAVMTALWHRDRTGEGQLIEVAQAENAAAMFTQAIMDYSLNGKTQVAIGNRDVHGQYPCGVYPAKSPGTVETQDDHWISISVQSDEQWQAFGEAIGSPEWAADARFATNEGRAEHYKEIDAQITEYTVRHGDYELMHRLQAAGVAAAPVLEASRMFDDEQLLARDFFREQTIEGAGTRKFVGPLWQFEKTPVEFFQAPATLGEHNEYVYKDLLGVSDEEYAKLEADGHIATEYAPDVP
jgi:benzylsuccinate CoA-transferase BbsF subunit